MHSDLDVQSKEERSEHDGTHGTLLGVEESNTNTEEVKAGTNQQEDDQFSSYNNNSTKIRVIENECPSTTTTAVSELRDIVIEEEYRDVKSLSSKLQSDSAPDTNNVSQASQMPNKSVKNRDALQGNNDNVSQASQIRLINTSKEGEEEVEEDVKQKEEEDLQQHNNNTNDAQTIIEQVSQVIPLPPPPSSCSPSQDNHVNESQSIRLDDAISLMSLPAIKSETSDLWNRIAPFSSIKVVIDTSQIKHTDDGSNDNIFCKSLTSCKISPQTKKQ